MSSILDKINQKMLAVTDHKLFDILRVVPLMYKAATVLLVITYYTICEGVPLNKRLVQNEFSIYGLAGFLAFHWVFQVFCHYEKSETI
mgnify:CR=1 FL=1|jgi:hypothetical protein